MRTFLIFLFSASVLLTTQKTMANVPQKTIVVDAQGTGDYKSVQDAVYAVRAFLDTTTVIRIKPGVYFEKITIPSWVQHLQLIGDTPENTVIQFDDYSGKNVGGTTLGTFNSHTMLVQGNHVQLKNLTVQNISCNQGQAVALHVEGDRFSALNVQLLGCQDTLYAGSPNSSQYYRDCYIEGTTDFIFGSATVFFDNCTIKSLKNSYITAASTPQENEYGFVFRECKLVAAEGVDRVFLGRPWRPHAKTVFIGCELQSHIVKEGWDPWKGDKTFPNKEKTAFYAEYENHGAGASAQDRVYWSHQLTPDQAERYTVDLVLGDRFW